METDTDLRSQIKDLLVNKSNLQQRVFHNTAAVFSQLKELLNEISSELDDETDEQLDRGVRIEYRDRGKFEAQLQVGSDILIFSMHTNVFEFNNEHVIWQNQYVSSNRDNSYCGMIQVYNFLADSFKYNRNDDQGYLIARIFINHEKQYFVEGKKQDSLRHDRFGTREIDARAIMTTLETAIKYALEFDLLVPPYDSTKVLTVEQFNTKVEVTKIETGKRLGYSFNTDDI